MKPSQKIDFVPEDGIFFLALLLGNLRASLFFPLFPATTFFPLGAAWFEILAWALLTAVMVTTLVRKGSLARYWEMWRRHKMLTAFILLAGLSIAWSISIPASLFRWLELFFATTLALYFAMHYDLKHFLDLLAWGGAILVITSAFIVILQPEVGISSGFPYYGAWRGIFWHRNQFGNLMSLLNMAYLFSAARYFNEDRPQSFFWGFFYLLTLALVAFSKSATAIIVTVVINSAFVLVMIWLRIRHLLTKKHYYLLGSAAVIAIVVIFANLDFLLVLLGRGSNLTGRTDLWKYLLQNIVIKHPWLGHGFGAIWNIKAFRFSTSKIIGWPFDVLIGDNGYMDILLHLGAIGLALFLALLISAYIRALKFAANQPDLFAFFPLFFMLYATLANISFSLFMETEMLVWTIVVMIISARYVVASADSSI